MKKLILSCSVLVLPGLSVFGQTNSVPVAAQPVHQSQRAAIKPVVTVSVVTPYLARNTEILPSTQKVATFRRIDQEGLLIPSVARNDPGLELKTIFSSGAANTDIRDTVVTIFPGG